MAIFAPFNIAENLITDVLTNVRRGITLSRMQNTADSTTGLLADLPERIDFEMVLLNNYQTLERSASTTENNASGESDGTKSRDLADQLKYEQEEENSKVKELASVSGKDSQGSTTGTSQTDGENLVGNITGTQEVAISEGTNKREGTDSSESESEGSLGGRSEQEKGDSGEQSGSKGKGDSRSGEKELGDESSQTSDKTQGKGSEFERECSDRYAKTGTDRKYWKVNTDTGAVAQA